MDNKDIEKILNKVEIKPREELKNRIMYKINNFTELKKTFYFKKFAIVLTICVIMISLLSVSGVSLYNEPYSQINIDINPSIEIYTNRFDVVNKIKYLNNDAKDLYRNLELRGLKLDDAIEDVLLTLDENDYLKEDNELFISGYSKNNSKVDSAYKHIEKYFKDNQKNINVNKIQLTKEDVMDAKREGLSPAKYKLINQIIELDNTLEIDELRTYTMKELKDLYSDLNKIKQK